MLKVIIITLIIAYCDSISTAAISDKVFSLNPSLINLKWQSTSGIPIDPTENTKALGMWLLEEK